MEAAVILEAAMQDARKNNIADVVSTYSKRLLDFIRRRVNTDAEDSKQVKYLSPHLEALDGIAK